MKSILVLVGISALAGTAIGHATFQDLWVDGIDQQSTCARLPTSNSPVQDVTSNSMRCMSSNRVTVRATLTYLAGNANQGPAASKCSVAAGGTVTIEMHQQNGDRSCASEAIGGAHYGLSTHVLHAPLTLTPHRSCSGLYVEGK
jgi:cellulase